MNLSETIKNIRATCNNYVDPDLLAFIIDDDNYMGTNNILEIEGYDIQKNDSYEDRLLKIAKKENIFLPIGMMTFMPILNECDIFSVEDYNLQLTQEEFDKYSDEEEKLFGILIKKDSNEYIIGKTDVCSCSVDASFEELEKTESEFYKKIKEIIDSKVIY
ncbi:MAG: hypothetical protein ILA26_05225 [Methanobrevibacter sp.]|uniref:hypothetical protein n=1 Tax=Methanobrevibacter sp. TaxID=66852 RepID=UPI001B5F26D2|nr:hypothetical protein [Methanobrevibacter sp.]MBP3791414.1 hypothetical protein [Methanobrevibacter sp.]